MQIINEAVIKIIGVGGAGCKLIDLLLEEPVNSIEYVAVDADAETLHTSSCNNKIRIGTEKTDCSTVIAKEISDKLGDIISGSDMAIVISGLGGVAGSQISPAIAQIAKEENVFMPVIAITPIGVEEGSEFAKIEASIKKIKNSGAPIFVIQNHKIKRIVADATSVKEIYRIGNEAIRDLLEGVLHPICYKSVVNLDCEDVFAVLPRGGLAYFGVGEGSGDNKVLDAVKNAVFNPLSYGTIEGKKRVIVSVTENSGSVLTDMRYAVDLIKQVVDPQALIVMAAQNEPIEKNTCKIAIIGG